MITIYLSAVRYEYNSLTSVEGCCPTKIKGQQSSIMQLDHLLIRADLKAVLSATARGAIFQRAPNQINRI